MRVFLDITLLLTNHGEHKYGNTFTVLGAVMLTENFHFPSFRDNFSFSHSPRLKGTTATSVIGKKEKNKTSYCISLKSNELENSVNTGVSFIHYLY